MTPQLKKVLLIGGSLLAIAAGIAIYSYRKNKPDNTDTGGDSGEENKDNSVNVNLTPDYSGNQSNEPKTSSGGSSWSTPTPKKGSWSDSVPKTNTSSSTPKTTTIVKLDDVLASSLTGANTKKIYGVIDGLKFYNLEGKEAGKTIKNKLLGNIAIVTKDSKGTKMVYFLGTNGVKYKMPSIGLNVAI